MTYDMRVFTDEEIEILCAAVKHEVEAKIAAQLKKYTGPDCASKVWEIIKKHALLEEKIRSIQKSKSKSEQEQYLVVYEYIRPDSIETQYHYEISDTLKGACNAASAIHDLRRVAVIMKGVIVDEVSE